LKICVRQMRPDETGATRDKYSQPLRSFIRGHGHHPCAPCQCNIFALH
jgi:hypothetical protein